MAGRKGDRQSSRTRETGGLRDYLATLAKPITLLIPDGNWGQTKRMLSRVPVLRRARPVRVAAGVADVHEVLAGQQELQHEVGGHAAGRRGGRIHAGDAKPRAGSGTLDVRIAFVVVRYLEPR